MADTNESWDFYLTPRGWEVGSEKLDFAGVTEVSPPSDRVKTVRYYERGSRWAIDRGLTVEWRSDDTQRLSDFEAKFGSKPPGETYKTFPLV